MATGHVYVRVQATGTNEQMQAIAEALLALQRAVDASGSQWIGGVQIEPDGIADTVPVPEPAAPVSVPVPDPPTRVSRAKVKIFGQ